MQIGLRGYWPGEEELAWQRERGITALVAERVVREILTGVAVRRAALAGSAPAARRM